jgi:hypothetical protein
MNNELNYLYDVTKYDVQGYYFIDYISHAYWNGKKLRETHELLPYLTSEKVAMRSASLNWENVDKFRVHTYEDLIEPVNEDGLTEKDCELEEVEFEPVRQKIEHMFGDRFRVLPESLDS